MANIEETNNFDEGVYQIETDDIVIGGSGGIANKASTNLANRTVWLKHAIELLQTSIGSININSVNGLELILDTLSEEVNNAILATGSTPTDDNKTQLADAIRHQVNSVRRNKNFIINGGFDIWQRATALSLPNSTPVNVADKWINSKITATTDINKMTFSPGQTDVPGNPKNYQRISKENAESVPNVIIEQRIEDASTFSETEVTISFWAKCNINKSFELQFNQDFGVNGSTPVDGLIADLNITTTWSKFKVSGVMPSVEGKTIGELSYSNLLLLEQSNFNNFDLDVAQFQVEYGSIATAFERRTISEEFGLCSRYCYRPLYSNEIPCRKANAITNGALTSSTFDIGVNLPLNMLGTPTIEVPVTSNLSLRSESGGAIANLNAAPTLFGVGSTLIHCSFNSADVSNVYWLRCPDGILFTSEL